jgi:hypothetical protein
MKMRYSRWSIGAVVAWLILVVGVCGYVYRMERRQQALENRISELDRGVTGAVGLLIQAIANIHERVKVLENPGIPVRGL